MGVGVGTRLCSRLTLFGSRDQNACLMAEPGIDTVHPGPPAGGRSCSLAPGIVRWAAWVAICCLGLPPLPHASSWLSQPRPTLAPVVAALVLTQSHR